MKLTVFKHGVALGDNLITIPTGSTIIKFGLDGENRLAVWYTRPDNTTNKDVIISVIFTGEPFNAMSGDVYLGTVTRQPLVYHAFIKL